MMIAHQSLHFTPETIEQFKRRELTPEQYKLLKAHGGVPLHIPMCNTSTLNQYSETNPTSLYSSLSKQVKHDPAAFNQIKDHSQQNMWFRKLKSTHLAQHIDKVPGINHNPITKEEIIYFIQRVEETHPLYFWACLAN